MASPGLDRAIQVGRRDWYAQGCARAIKQLAAAGRPFTADDVRDLVGETDDPHMIGVAFAVASRSKLIELVSVVVDRSGRPARVWNRVRSDTDEEVGAVAEQAGVAEDAPRGQ